MWQGLKSMAGMTKKSININVEKGKEQDYVESLNTFYARFDNHDFSNEIEKARSLLGNVDDSFVIEQYEVDKCFSKLKSNKASGPDGLSPKILKLCSKQLSYIYCTIFNMSLNICKIPTLWKTSKIIPVPKTSNISQMNDLRPVALTPVIMKCLEKIVLSYVIPFVNSSLDPLQFAYKPKRSVEDAILYFTSNIYRHLDTPKSYVRTLFVDFSSAFNTIQPHLLMSKLIDYGVLSSTSRWILDFLTGRPQYVFLKLKTGDFTSAVLFTNTGAPQGTVLAPLLFSIYTNSCSKIFDNIPIIKYADDTSIQALIKCQNDLSNYFSEVSRFCNWCENHFLLLNVKKTKELIIDFRKSDYFHESIIIQNEIVERVLDYKYLGVFFDEKLDWIKNSESLQAKIHQRLHFMRKLSSFSIDKTILNLFFESCVMSLFYFSITAWGGNIRAVERDNMERVIKHCLKLVNAKDMISVDDILQIACRRKLNCVLKDNTHPLYVFLEFSSRSGRLLHVKTKTSRHLNSFLPYAIRNY